MIKYWFEIGITIVVGALLLGQAMAITASYGAVAMTATALAILVTGALVCMPAIQKIKEHRRKAKGLPTPKATKFQKAKAIHSDAMLFSFLTLVSLYLARVCGLELSPEKTLLSLLGSYLIGIGFIITCASRNKR